MDIDDLETNWQRGNAALRGNIEEDDFTAFGNGEIHLASIEESPFHGINANQSKVTLTNGRKKKKTKKMASVAIDCRA